MGSTSETHYHDSIKYLFGLQKHGIKFGLNSTLNILSRVGNPHERLQCIHIAGTNGKGSTAAMLSSILKEHGLKVGLYTSPHLVRFTERFRVDDAEVSPDRILETFRRIYETLDPREIPTFFEMVTAMGLLYFAEEGVDWAVVETGMGGKLDATNVIHPRLSIITNVSFDHQDFLGKTLSAIARQKAGIIKENVPLVSGVCQPLVVGILKATCYKMNAPLYLLRKDFRVRRNADGSFLYQGLRRRWNSLDVNLTGNHQMQNAALALAGLESLEKRELLSIDSNAVERGLAHVHWPARLEVLQENPLIILDGAHNPQGAEALRDALQKRCFSYRKLHLVVGIMADKDIRGMLRTLLPLAETVIFTKPRYVRAASPEMLRRLARPFLKKHYVIPDPASAIQQAKTLADSEDLICITGSLYFAGEIKELFGEPTL